MLSRALRTFPLILTLLSLTLVSLATEAETKIGNTMSLLTRLLGANGDASVRVVPGTLRINGAEFAYATRTSALSPERSLAEVERSLGALARCARHRARAMRYSVCLIPPHPLTLSDLDSAVRERDLRALGPLSVALAFPGRQGTTVLTIASAQLPLRDLLTPNEALSMRAFSSIPFEVSDKQPVLLVSKKEGVTETPLLAVTKQSPIDENLTLPRMFPANDEAHEWLVLRARSSKLFFTAHFPK